MDSVFITGLKVSAVIGVHEWEKKIQQTLIFDLELAQDNQRAARRDHIDDALDYAAISQVVTDYVQSQPRQLIESLAEEVAALILDKFDTAWVKLSLRKPNAVPAAQTVGVRIERQREEA